jgi:peptidoglycan LD-endopeptidase CwlK
MRLSQINPTLASVVKKAAEITTQPFVVLEGLRSSSRQRELYNQGKTQTLNSNHLTGFAVDLAPLVNGTVSWDWEHYYLLANAMDKAADSLSVPLTWGASWTSTTEDWEDPREAVRGYTRIRRSQGRNPFLDGPHWEIPKKDQYLYKQNKPSDSTLTKKEITKEFQKLVNRYDGDLVVDGIWGPNTQNGVIKLIQRAK